MDPRDRPLKRRRGARVVVVNDGHVLLMADRDPGVPGSGWWVTPGGGIEGDETARAAAARELFEETGFRCDEADLTGPIARRVATHGYSDRVLVQEEEFFLLEVPSRFDVVTEGLTVSEQTRMGGWGWFSPAELSPMDVWPATIRDLVQHRPGDPCRDLGMVDESTVPA